MLDRCLNGHEAFHGRSFSFNPRVVAHTRPVPANPTPPSGLCWPQAQERFTDIHAGRRAMCTRGKTCYFLLYSCGVSPRLCSLPLHQDNQPQPVRDPGSAIHWAIEYRHALLCPALSEFWGSSLGPPICKRFLPMTLSPACLTAFF